MKQEEIVKKVGKLHKPNPWHGVSFGDNFPNELTAFIEIVPTDTVKYEIDKATGYLMIDRPQKFSNIFPALYGFVPRTYCAEKVAAYSAEKTGKNLEGDKDPIDIVVLSERAINHGDILVNCLPIGGIRMLDKGEADDKIVAVLHGDSVYGDLKDISECPKAVLDRILHYFLTYKQAPGKPAPEVEIAGVYGVEEARKVLQLSHEDYLAHYGDVLK